MERYCTERERRDLNRRSLSGPEPITTVLTLRLLGRFEAQLDGAPVRRRSRKGEWLLALLILHHDEAVERAGLAGLLWPDSPTSSALALLRRELTDLRRALGPDAERLQSPSYRTLRLELAEAEVDLLTFDRAIERGDTASLEQAVSLYRGPLLEGCTEEWVFQERQAREQAYLSALETLAQQALAQGDRSAAEQHLRRVVAVDPLRESTQRALLQALAEGGNYAAVVQSYRQFRERLHEELHADPDPQTAALFEQLRTEARRKAAHSSRLAAQGGETAHSSRVTAHPPASRTPADEGRLDRESPFAPASAIPDGENRLVTVLFADMCRFLETTRELEPEDTAELVSRLLAAMGDAIQQNAGQIDRFQGDGVLAVFGVPQAHEEDAERAIRAALAIRAAAEGLAVEIRAGITTGEVYAGAVGAAPHQEMTVIGPAVSLAARLQEVAQPGEVLVGEATYRQTRRAFTFTPRQVMVKGLHQPVVVYRVDEALTRPEKSRGIEGLRATLIGREEELAKLQAALDRLLQGQGQMVSVIGEAGVGKSRLVAELRAAVGVRCSVFGVGDGPSEDRTPNTEHPLLWLEGRCMELEMTTSYGPFLDALRDYLGWHPDDSEATRAETLVASLRELVMGGYLSEARFEEVVPLLGDLLGLQSGNERDQPRQRSSPEQMREETFLALRDLLLALSLRQPVVLVLEDLHWGDTLSMDLISVLMETVESAPLLLLCIYRPDPEHKSRHLGTIAAHKCAGRSTELTLRALPLAQSRRLVESLLQIDNLPSGVREAILAQAGGNPFFLEEIIRSLFDSGIMYREDGVWQAREEIAAIAVPESVQSVIQSRVDRLEPELKEVLQNAAVIGRVFPRRLLEAVCGQGARSKEQGATGSGELALEPMPHAARSVPLAPYLERALWALEERALVYQERVLPEAAYSFQHVLTQETVYRNILRRHRALIHRRVAEAIEWLHGERLNPHCELLAHHYQQAGVAEKAVEYYLRAGEKALHLYANEEAIQHLTAALRLLDGLPTDETHLRTRWRVVEALSRGYLNCQEPERAQGVCQEYLTLAEATGDPRATAAAHLKLGSLPSLKSLEDLEKAVGICEQQKVIELLTPARLGLAHYLVLGKARDFPRAEALLRQMLEDSQSLDSREARDAYELLVEACARQGKWKEAAIAFHQCITAGGSHVVVPTRSLSLMESTLDREGRRAEFVAFCDEARALLDEAGIQTTLSQWYLEPAQPSKQFNQVVFLDGFDPGELRAEWQWHDPIRVSRYSLSDRPGYLTLYSHLMCDLWPTNNLNAPRLLLEVRGDFALEARVEGDWDYGAGSSGLLIWKDVRNFIRFDKMGMSTWHYGDLSLEGCVEGEYQVWGRGRLPGETYFLRLERTGERCVALCSTDGAHWLTCGSLEFPADDALLVGIHSIGGLLAHFDYVRVRGSGRSD